MAEAFNLMAEINKDINIKIIGEWNNDVQHNCLNRINPEFRNRFVFIGQITKIENYLSDAALCLHTSRGDAFPTSTIEAMAAGVPVIVSEWTGTRELAEKVSSDFISTLQPNDIASKVLMYFDLSLSDKIKISDKFRAISTKYTLEKAKLKYIEVFNQIKRDLNFHGRS
jgi:glycosyltransferase involved in cell wall biosynthesis